MLEENQEQPVNILLVDDRADGLLAMEVALRSRRYNIRKAGSGEDALRMFLRDDFAVVILDVHLPRMDGFQTAHAMHAAQEGRKTPIIFVTGIRVDPKHVHAGYEAGAVDYLLKPIDAHVLRSKVSVFVENFLLFSELQRRNEIIREAESREHTRILSELEVENDRRYLNLADSIPHVVLKADAHGLLNYFNGMWFAYTGLSSEASRGDGWMSAIHPDEREAFFRAWRSATQGHDPFEMECRIHRRSDGMFRWNLFRAIPERDGSNALAGWIGTLTDIHERQLLEEQRETLLQLETEAKASAEAASRAKSQFLANMSHEIRTPISVIIGYSELIASNHIDTESAEANRAVLRNGKHLLRLLDDILDLSKVESGKIELEMSQFSPIELIGDVLRGFDLQHRSDRVVLRAIDDSSLAQAVVSDPTRIRQILMNLVGNALKFTKQGDVSVAATVTESGTTADDLNLTITIRDTGIGLSAAEKERLFQHFVQADSSTTRRFGGTGLGLALSRQLAQLMGGGLTLVESEVERGSTFQVWVRVQRAKGSALVREGIRSPSTPNALSSGPGLSPLRVLLAEDTPDTRVLMERILRNSGALVELAGNGQEALCQALDRPFDVILMDIQMPVMDGYKATACLRGAGYRYPIIALTAHAMTDERERCLNSGFDDVMTKPIEFSKLLLTLKSYVPNTTSAFTPKSEPSGIAAH